MKKLLTLIFGFSFLTACNSSKKLGGDDGRIDINIVQINDVYEIAPLENGKSGGMARVAQLKKNLLSENPNTYMIMAGDFLSPSVYNSLKYENVRIRGKQMVAAMNAAGIDLVAFGNHEFDIAENELQQRINESSFNWVSTNTFHKTTSGIKPFIKISNEIAESIPKYYFKTFSDADGTVVKIGFLGITLPFNKAPYVTYEDALESAKQTYEFIKDSCDRVIAITHQLIEDDIILAKTIPGLMLISGGHEHDMRFEKIGNVFITKAHANAKSAYVSHIRINKNKHTFSVKPELIMIDEHISSDSATHEVVKKWVDIADKNFASIGFDPKDVVMAKGDPLDGRESVIRSQSTNLSQLIIAAMEKAAPEANVAIVNSGSIRVDDILNMPVSQYDIIRTLPFGGAIVEVDMKGKLLENILATGKSNIGIGGFLQYSRMITTDGQHWMINGSLIQPEKIYRVAMTDFLITGGEANLGFLTKDNPYISNIYPISKDLKDPRTDIRIAIIRYLKIYTE